MKAYIMGKSVLEVEVKKREILPNGMAVIWDTFGVIYETHISNVIFVKEVEA